MNYSSRSKREAASIAEREGEMKPASTPREIVIAAGIAVYGRMTRLAMDSNQTVGPNHEYFVTLAQLEKAFIDLREEISTPPQQEERKP